ncbi:2OG-Fe(II) oxygenase family protein [Pelagibacteraceae bacterium]|nr:2OG-Fe(II) oxygenase family protein [Pelagibacteraceae bacterium]
MSKIKVLAPFGPRIARLKFPQSVIRKINLEVDRITKQKKLIKKYDYSKNLVGQVKQEIQLPSIFIKKNIYKYISSSVKEYVKASTGKLTKKVKIMNFWIVRQYAHEYNPVHYHDGHVSGVGYLKLPKQLNKDKKKLKTNGSIDFINGSKMFLSNSVFNHNPKIGDAIMFPNYLMHTAYPFSVDGERRSFSFNVEIDRNIANVFKK